MKDSSSFSGNKLRTKLSVNLNKVALIRNTRHLENPSVIRSGEICLEAGAHGLTVHPRPDQRHIRDQDVIGLSQLLKSWPNCELNVEGNPFHNLMQITDDLVTRGMPVHQLTFVPDSKDQFTSDAGWNLEQHGKSLKPLIDQVHAWGLRVSLFMDAEPTLITFAKDINADRVELYTEPYASSWGTANQGKELKRFVLAANAAIDIGLKVNAGHDLNLKNLKVFSESMPKLEEVSIGHALVSDALEFGFRGTVARYLNCLGYDLDEKIVSP